MMKESVYLMPGMGANPRIFEFLSLTDRFEIHHLSWFPPEKDETLSDYALRMSKRIKGDNAILVGVSFGGVLVQEMSKHLNSKKVIIISSIKSNQELPNPMKLAQKTNAHRLLPTQWIKNLESFSLFVFGHGIQRRLSHFNKYLSERDRDYLNWAIDRLIKWDRREADPEVIHIHGREDSVFPVKNIQKPFIEISGDHAIILTRSDWFNRNLPKIIM
jgi:pimeloyl-ACP methyl ester carboxylesterase